MRRVSIAFLFLMFALSQLFPVATRAGGGTGKDDRSFGPLQGNLAAPSNLTATANGNRVNLAWRSPAPSSVENFGGDEQSSTTETEPNNGFSTAQAITLNSTVSGSAQVSDSGEYVIGFADGTRDDFEDVFRLTLTQTTKVSIKLTFSPSTADCDVWVLSNDSRLTVLDDDGASTDNPEVTTLDLNAGTYLIAVSTFEPGPPTPPQDATYTLSVTGPGVTPPPALTGFNVYRSTSSPVATTSANRVTTLSAGVTTFSDSPTPADGRTVHNYVVTAVYDAGESGPSNQASATPGAGPSDTTPPTVTVTAPNGGETVASGSNLSITWTSSDNVGLASHDVALSTDGGLTYATSVASGLAGSVQSFSYGVPSTLASNAARVRVTAKDAAGNSGADASNSDFTIGRADTTPPTVQVLSPNAATDKLKAGSSFLIRWQSSDNIGLAGHDVLLSTDGGATFPTTVATGLPGTAREFNFAVPATQAKSKTGRIRVVARDAAGNRAQDDSDANFKIKARK